MEVTTLDLSKADGYTATEFDFLKKALRRSGRYREDLLYHGFDGANISRLLKTGQDTDAELLFCFKEDEIDGDSNTASLFHYAYEDHSIPAIAVFDPSKLNHIGYPTEYAYTFKNPGRKLEALVAVFKLAYRKARRK